MKNKKRIFRLNETLKGSIEPKSLLSAHELYDSIKNNASMFDNFSEEEIDEVKERLFKAVIKKVEEDDVTKALNSIYLKMHGGGDDIN